jgi:hypothetical protein
MTTPNDRDCLRTLAAEYAEIANGADMKARRERWRRSNRLLERTVPFQIEDNGTFLADLMPPPVCEGEIERALELQLRKAVYNFRLIDDDRVFPPCCAINWQIVRPELCPELTFTYVADASGRKLGHETNTPLANLAADFHKLVRRPFTVDRDATHRQAEIATAAFGDLLPVRIVTQWTLWSGCSLTSKAVRLMGMDNFYMAMLDQPEQVHRFFDFATNESLDFQRWLETERLATPNNGEFSVGSGSCGFTDELPAREIRDGARLMLADCWGFQEAQESVGLSPEMYAAFIHPYQRRTSDGFGLLYYGCCEPVHQQWPVIRQFRNLRKITVSPWCDQASIAGSAGRSVVLSRKPHTMKLCGEVFDAAAFEADIRETLEIARDNFIELIFRDNCRIAGGMKPRIDEACRIIHRLIGRMAGE